MDASLLLAVPIDKMLVPVHLANKYRDTTNVEQCVKSISGLYQASLSEYMTQYVQSIV